MVRIGPLSVRHKLILMALAASSAGVILAGALSLTYDAIAYRGMLANDLETMTDMVGSNATAALTFGDAGTAEDVLRTLRFQPHVTRACIYTREGALFASYARDAQVAECPRAQADGRRFHGGRLEQFRPIELKQEVIGTVYVETDLEAIRHRLKAFAAVLLAIVLISVSAAFLLAMRLQALISRPILELVQTAEKVSRERDYSVRARHSSDDEMGRLIDSFNQMLEKIERHEEQMEERNAQLDSARAAAETLALHDTLTDLPNRSLLQSRLAEALSRCERNPQRRFALLYLDLDHFKVINDSLGHEAGDELLVKTAERLRSVLRRTDTVAHGSSADNHLVARLGGDEFTILLDEVRDAADAVRVAERIHASLGEPIHLRGRNIRVTASIGIAVSSNQYRTSEEMLRDADTAMYRAKAMGRGGCVVFDNAMHVWAMERLHLESELRQAIENQQLLLVYQPVVDLRCGQVAGFEALVRWQNSRRGIVSPAEFIPLAEETGIILPLGAWVLREACHRMHSWQRDDGRDPHWVSVNISGRQFAQPDFVEQVASTLRETGLEGGNLRLELTETVAMKNAERARIMIERLRDVGVRVSIDDFGTGYSSLDHLHSFSVDTLKIDRSFVVNMNADQKNREIIKSIMGLAAGLGMNVVAEGTETAEHVHMLRQMGCGWAQGHYFFPPLEAAQVERLLELGDLSAEAQMAAAEAFYSEP